MDCSIHWARERPSFKVGPLPVWMSFVAPALVALVWLALPGLALGIALRIRVHVAALMAPLLSVAIIGISAIVAPLVGLSWGPLPPLLLTAVLCAGVSIPRVLGWGRHSKDKPSRSRAERQEKAEHSEPAGSSSAAVVLSAGEQPGPHPLRRRSLELASRWFWSLPGHTWVALAASCVGMAYVVVQMLGRPDNFSQTWDAVFHLNALRWILDTGSASSFDVSGMGRLDGEGSFYPATWHAIGSLVLTTLGSSDVVLGTNATMFAVATLAWPASILAFVTVWTPGPLARRALLPAAVLSVITPAFPYMFISYGVLYPNFLGYCLIPAFAALFGALLGRRRRLDLSWPALLLYGSLGTIALGFSHPSAAMAFLAGAVALTAGFAFSPDGRRRWYWCVAYLAIAAALYGVCSWIWPLLRPVGDAANSWPPRLTPPDALGNAVFMWPLHSAPLAPLMIVAAIGVAASLRYREYSVLALWGAFTFLFIVAAGWPDTPERTAIVGPWYSDPVRLAALIPIASIPLGAVGIAYAATALGRASRNIPAVGARITARGLHITKSAFAIAFVAAVVLSMHANPKIEEYREHLKGTYQVRDDSNLLSVREKELIDQIPAHVPKDATIYVNPMHGEALVYGFTGINTTSKHQQEENTSAELYLDQNLDNIDHDPRVCTAVNILEADYAVVFFGRQINNSEAQMPGLENLEKESRLELVAQSGGAYLYKINGCKK